MADERCETAQEKLLACRATLQRPEDANAVIDGEEVDGEDPYAFYLDPAHQLPLAPVDFVCSPLQDPYNCYLGDASVIFCFSSCMPPEVFQSFAEAIGRQCRPGTVVITTEYMLPLEGNCPLDENDPNLPHGDFQFRLAEKMNGYSWLMGGQSTAFIHQVVRSSWRQEHPGPFSKPQLSLEEIAYRAVQQAEQDGNPKAFLVGVYNNMVFSGLPDRFWPNLSRFD